MDGAKPKNKLSLNERIQRRDESEPDKIRRDTCLKCWRKRSLCFCEDIIDIPTETEFVLLMHPKEAKKQKLGTGRMTHASMPHSSILIDVNFDNNTVLQEMIADPKREVMLMYPAPDAINIDTFDTVPEQLSVLKDEGKTLTLLFLDATWPCAKKMMKLSTCLHYMPKVSFQETYKGRFLIKHQPHENCLSTLETVYYAIKGLKKMGHETALAENQEENLFHLMDKMIEFQVKCASDPTIVSTRGKKSVSRPSEVRVREKRHRLFYYDVEKSPVGDGPSKK